MNSPAGDSTDNDIAQDSSLITDADSLDAEAPRAVSLLNFVDCSIDDEEELAEVLDSARELMDAFGSVESIVLSGADKERAVVVTYSSGEEAMRAQKAIHGAVFGGLAVDARLVHSSTRLATNTSADVKTAVTGGSATDGVSGKSVEVITDIGSERRHQYDSLCTVAIHNFVFTGDIEDEEEAADVLRDCLQLCDKFSPSALWLEKTDAGSFTPVQLCAPGVSPSVAGKRTDSTMDPTACPLGLLTFSSMIAAAACRDYICASNGVSAFLVSGQAAALEHWSLQGMFGARATPTSIEMNVYFCVKLSGIVASDDIADEEERADVVEEINSLCTKRLADFPRADAPRIDSVLTADVPSVDCIIFGQSRDSTDTNKSDDKIDVYVMVNVKEHYLGDSLRLSDALTGLLIGGAVMGVSVCCINNSVIEKLLESNASTNVKDLNGSLVSFEAGDMQTLSMPSHPTSDDIDPMPPCVVAVLGLPWQVAGGDSFVDASGIRPEELLENALWRFEWKLALLITCGYPSSCSQLKMIIDDNRKSASSGCSYCSSGGKGKDFYAKLPNFLKHLCHSAVIGINLPLTLNDVLDSQESTSTAVSRVPWEDNKRLDVCVAFSSIDEALAAHLYLDQLVIGGSRIIVSVQFGDEGDGGDAADSGGRNQEGGTNRARGLQQKSMAASSPLGLSVDAPVFIPKISSADISGPDVATSISASKVIIAPPRLPRRTGINADIVVCASLVIPTQRN